MPSNSIDRRDEIGYNEKTKHEVTGLSALCCGGPPVQALEGVCMSYADQLFIDMCRDILDNGTSTEGEKVRPRWEDGTAAYTIKRFGRSEERRVGKEC